MPWHELERRLSDRELAPTHSSSRGSDQSESRAWSRRKTSFESHVGRSSKAAIPYAELHTHSHFSFLDGASSPEELVLEAARLGLETHQSSPALNDQTLSPDASYGRRGSSRREEPRCPHGRDRLWS